MSQAVLLSQLHFNHKIFHANLGTLTHEESLLLPQPAGNCLNWLAGHVVTVRGVFLVKALGLEAPWSDEVSAPYQRGAATWTADASPALPIEEVRAAFERTQTQLREWVEGHSDAELAAPAPFSVIGDPNETLATLLGTFLLHDAYHIGQTGAVRRTVGLPGVIR